MSSFNNSNNKKILYQLWTDGRGGFAVKKEKGIKLFEYSYSQQSCSKVIDSKRLYEDSITKELVQDWIEELKEADILDENGNLMFVKF